MITDFSLWNFEILKLLWNFYWSFLSQIKTKIAHWNSSTSLILLYVIFTGQHFWNWKNLQSRVTYRFFISLVFLFWTLIYKVNFQVAVFIYPQSTLHCFGSSAIVHVWIKCFCACLPFAIIFNIFWKHNSVCSGSSK